MDMPLPLMRGRYCRRHRLLNLAMQAVDTLLCVCLPFRRRGRAIVPPRRLLISNLAHLGDLVTATSILPVLKSAFPDCRIGFLAGSWARPVLQDHPLVDDIHILDHWAANRAALPRREKMRQYHRTRRQALREVRAAGYEAALDLSWNFPNLLPFLWQARIPARIGYGSSGFGPLATHCLAFDAQPLPVFARYLALVRELPVERKDMAQAAMNLPPVRAEDQEALDRELLDRELLDQKLQARGQADESGYFVLHVGAGLGLNAWPQTQWRALAEKLRKENKTLVFTGSGARDAALIEEITHGLAGCINLCGQLSWSGFVAAISGARLVICVDTAAAHVAGAVKTPCAVIVTGRNPYLWHVPSRDCQVVTLPVPCAPCHRGLGCAGMECIRGVEVEQVYQAAGSLLDNSELKGRQ